MMNSFVIAPLQAGLRVPEKEVSDGEIDGSGDQK